MSTIRPLATLTLLLAVGVFLWMRINDAPLVPADGEDLSLSGAPTVELGPTPSAVVGGEANAEPALPVISELPPLAATSTPPAPTTSPAEKPKATAPAPQPATTVEITPKPTAGEPSLGPAMPDLPPVTSATPPPTTSAGPTVSGRVPSLGTAVGAAAVAAASAADATKPAVSPDELNSTPLTPPPATATTAVAPAPASEALPPLPAMSDRYGSVTTPPAPATTAADQANSTPITAPASSSAYSQARAAIDSALQAGELARAHLLLTTWYGDPSLTPEEQTDVENLLSQLAGTVVYSNQHQLEPPYTVQPGETLETIAQRYQVPWELLAKVNGVTTPAAVVPGQTIKVIRGPFQGVIDLDRQQLALLVDGRYAGRFSVKSEGSAATESEWTVAQKQTESTPAGLRRRVVLSSSNPQVAPLVLTADAATSVGPGTFGGAIRLDPTDEADLYDILSVGSRVTIRR